MGREASDDEVEAGSNVSEHEFFILKFMALAWIKKKKRLCAKQVILASKK
jgi:hypothetical protein